MNEEKQKEVESLIREHMNKMRGQICGLIEAVGMPDRQERGAINTFKTLSYAAENDIVALIKK